MDLLSAEKEVAAAKKAEFENFKKQRKDLKKKKKTLQKELSALNKKKDSPEIEQRRKDIHCELADIEKVIGEDGDHGTLALREFQKSVYYDNILAKLHLLVNWPVEKQKTLSAIQSGEIKKEKFSDVKDIGARGGVFNDQSKDIDIGKQAWEEAIKNGDIREDEIVKDSEVIEYFEKLLKNIETDVKVPLKLFVINKQMTREPFVGEPEINAFALPGGILAVETGLIAYSENESELVGVVSHELAHIAARHSHRIMSKAGMRSLLLNLGYLAMIIFTGGYGAAAYALYYGLQALGFVFSLELLGVSRDFELEADTLGVQYAYTSGYDPDGFVNFFDKMATKFGYAQSTSFFATHPAFSERVMNLAKQSVYLKSLNLKNVEELTIDSSDFQKVRAKVRDLIEKEKEKMKKDSANVKRPTLSRKSKTPCPQN